MRHKQPDQIYSYLVAASGTMRVLCYRYFWEAVSIVLIFEALKLQNFMAVMVNNISIDFDWGLAYTSLHNFTQTLKNIRRLRKRIPAEQRERRKSKKLEKKGVIN